MNLGDREMAIVRHILGAMVPEYEVWVFGSRIHGRFLKKFSDIDLVIIADAPVDSGRLSELKEAFSESDLPYRVDVVDFASASRTFRSIIQQEYEVIQKPGPAIPEQCAGASRRSRRAEQKSSKEI